VHSVLQVSEIVGVVVSRRERAKEDKMRRILAASANLFSLHGFDGTTVQQIAGEADVAVGTLFLYVLDKGEILLLLFHRAIEQRLKLATKALSKGKRLIPAIHRFLREMMEPYEENLELSKIFWREFLFHKGKIRGELDLLTAALLQALRDRIATSRDKQEIAADVDVDAAALQMYAIYHSTLAFYLAGCLPDSSPSETLDALLQLAWKGLEPRDKGDKHHSKESDGPGTLKRSS
jgi:AcrR family transcriptional regulator